MLIYVLLVYYTFAHDHPEDAVGLVKGYTNENDGLDAYDKLTSLITPGDGVSHYELRPMTVKEHML